MLNVFDRFQGAAVAAGLFILVAFFVYLVAQRTLWELTELLVVPLALVAIGFWFTARQDTRQLEIGDERAQNAALQAYLGQMDTLLLKHHVRNSPMDSEARTLARARTLTVLGRLDPRRKREVMQFLVEAKLVQGEEENAPIIPLQGASLNRVYLNDVDLRGVSLRQAQLNDVDMDNANLSGADLSDADMWGIELGNATLSNADLSDAKPADAFLRDADLNGANLSKAFLFQADLISADLSGANLSEADLSEADLSDTNLSEADLSGAILRDADSSGAYQLTKGGPKQITDAELERQTRYLEGAIMPDGSTHP